MGNGSGKFGRCTTMENATTLISKPLSKERITNGGNNCRSTS